MHAKSIGLCVNAPGDPENQSYVVGEPQKRSQALEHSFPKATRKTKVQIIDEQTKFDPF